MERVAFDVCYDFEDALGRLVSEEETHGDVNQQDTNPFHGNFNLQITFDGTGLELRALDDPQIDDSEHTFRLGLYIDSNIGGLDADTLYMLHAMYDVTFTHAVVLYIATGGAGNPIALYLADSGGLVAATATGFAADVYMTVDVHWKEAVAGVLEAWIDDVAFDTQGAGDNSAMTPIGYYILTGSLGLAQTLYPSNGEFLRYDDLVYKKGGTVRIGEYAIPWDRRRRGY